MVNSKNKHSSNLHLPRNRTVPHYSSAKTKKLILVIIFLAIFIVIIATVCSIFFTNEKLVQSKIETLATDYYENYFYPNFSNSEAFKTADDLGKVMEKYETYGFAPVSLRQLLLYDDQKNAEYTNFLTKYCDENATTIKFYAEPPYAKNSYHVEYHYACSY